MYLTPNVSRSQSKVKKAKYQNSGARDLFSVLRTPDVIRKMDVSGQYTSFTDSPRKPSILKHNDGSTPSVHDDCESDRMSERSSHSKLRVSFDMDGRPTERPKTARGRVAKVGVAFSEISEGSSQCDDDSSMADNSEFDQDELTNQDTDSDSSRRR